MPKKDDNKAKPKLKRAANGFVMALKVPLGEVLTDVAKKKWVVGPPIGQGGFGTIYSAREECGNPKDYPFVVKIEPHENGPLFVEMHFYMKCGKPEQIEEYLKQKKLPHLNLPQYLGSGSHEIKGMKHRFVVTNKFGEDLWSIFKLHKKFPFGTILRIAQQTLQVLEYIHSKDYAHCDVKGANLLIGNTSSTKNRVYLVDFGLASRCTSDAVYTEDARKSNNGTIEYLSRDAHRGVVTKRGDLEVLAFNMIHWLCSTLPWEQVIAMDKKGKEKTVEEMKIKFMENISESLSELKIAQAEKAFLKKFLEKVKSMGHLDKPDYKTLNKMISDALHVTGFKETGPLNFSATKTSPRGVSKARSAKRAVQESEDEVEEELVPPKKKGKTAEKVTPEKAPRGRSRGLASQAKESDSNDLAKLLKKSEKTPKGRKARQSMSSEEENLVEGVKPENPRPRRLGRSVLAKMEAEKAAAAAQKNGTAHLNGNSSSSSKDSDTTPEKKTKKKKGAEKNKGTGIWKLCPTVMNSNVETPGTYSPPANAPSRNKKK
ncbi:serine/threonine-protein kinase VRK1-like [Neocloeon triangulifer]|uniref:serine/threonine-protein kinase VRK1-like n=1 Tax=Neocloeon triangulifer TaxID=2078957 RepID=UPI00286F6512|nr:serine/threonine-protein kinase VRK1-like [Neocloeon triangulifer]